MSIQDLDSRFPIVNPDGTPSAYLMRLLRDRGSEQKQTASTVEELAEEVVRLEEEKADKIRQIIAGGGLTGGGDLSEDRTLNIGAGSGIAVDADAVRLNAGINLLTDVDTVTTPPASGQALVWDGSSQWKPGTVGGGGGGSYILAKAQRTAAASTASGAWNALLLDNQIWDTAGIFDPATGRFTPNQQGVYLVNLRLKTATAGGLAVGVRRNGSIYVVAGGDVGTCFASGGSVFIYANGTTDYFELAYFANTVRSITTALDTYMEVIGPVFAGVPT